ncbi:MAG: hypothetical protein FH751_03895 [Firmicutes bacterium]|nr:hypothetical protein [Bacillota bacterium]
MLVIKCSKCKNKIFKYKKIGKGKVLKCFKDRITRTYDCVVDNDCIKCTCGNIIGIDEGNYYKMNKESFTYTGRKIKR